MTRVSPKVKVKGWPKGSPQRENPAYHLKANSRERVKVHHGPKAKASQKAIIKGYACIHLCGHLDHLHPIIPQAHLAH
jgi:hypothetical protein